MVWMAREIGTPSDDDRSLGYDSSCFCCFFLPLLCFLTDD